MSLQLRLQERSHNKCELCTSTMPLSVHTVAPKVEETLDSCAYLCDTCTAQVENPSIADSNHWRCLYDSMWNENIPVKILAYRMLDYLKGLGWPRVLLDMMYLDDEELKWAKATFQQEEE